MKLRWQSDAGSALVELAMVMPVLVAILFVTMDFGRVFYHAMAVTNAARAGCLYGAQSASKSSDTAGMASTALASAATDVGTITATGSRTCQCASSSGVFSATTPTANDCSNACSGGRLAITVSVTASKTFTTRVAYPGIPSSITITRTASMRAQ